MRVVTYNVQFCRGRDGQTDAGRIADAIASADIVGLQEVDRFARRSGDFDQAAAIGERLPDHDWVYGPTVDVLAAGRPPGNRRRQFGNMILSRWPILSSRLLLYVPKTGGANHLSLQLGALETVIAVPERPVRVYCTHLHHLSPTLRARQIDQLLAWVRGAPAEGPVISGDGPDGHWDDGGNLPPVPADAILLGDFNLTPDSDNYTQIVGPRAPHARALHGPLPATVQRLLAVDGFADAWVAAGHEETGGVTFFDDVASGLGRRLDYGFVTPALATAVTGAWIDADADGSDHQPAWFELRL